MNFPAQTRVRTRRPITLLSALLVMCLAFTGLTVQSASAADTGKITGNVFTKAVGGSNVPANYTFIYLSYSKTIDGFYDNVDSNPATPGTDGFSFNSGTFTLSGLKAGYYKFEVAGVSNSTGAGTSTGAFQREYYNDGESLGSATPIQVGTGTTTVNNMVLEPAGQITGKVTDRAGAPLANASISFEDSARGGGGYATTDANGNFTSETNPANGFGRGLVARKYRVSASKYASSPDAPTYEQRYWGNSASYSGATDVTVAPGATTSNINIVLDIAPRIRLTVKDPAGKPIPNHAVGIWEIHDGVWGPAQYGPNETDAAGVFRKTVRIGARYKFYITPPSSIGGAIKWFDGVYNVTDAAEVAATAYGQVRNIEIKLDRAPTISGTAQTGKALVARPSAGTPPMTNLTYQWLASGAAIRGATKSTFKVTNSQAGKSLAVKITGRLADSTTRSETSVITSKVVGVLTTKKVSISGKAKVGKRLTAKTSLWGAKPIKTKYQWYRNGKKISKQAKKTYTLRKADKGKRITVRVYQLKSSYKTANRLSSKTSKVK